MEGLRETRKKGGDKRDQKEGGNERPERRRE
jgi:hypothetical protein